MRHFRHPTPETLQNGCILFLFFNYQCGNPPLAQHKEINVTQYEDQMLESDKSKSTQGTLAHLDHVSESFGGDVERVQCHKTRKVVEQVNRVVAQQTHRVRVVQTVLQAQIHQPGQCRQVREVLKTSFENALETHLDSRKEYMHGINHFDNKPGVQRGTELRRGAKSQLETHLQGEQKVSRYFKTF